MTEHGFVNCRVRHSCASFDGLCLQGGSVTKDGQRETNEEGQLPGRAGVRRGEVGRRFRRWGDSAGVCVCVSFLQALAAPTG